MPAGISPGGRPIDESPLSTSKTDNWVARNGGLPPYVRGIARGIAKKHGGKVTSSDIAIAWAQAKKLGLTSKNPAVKAAGAKATAQELALRARAKTHNLSWDSFDQARGTKPKQPKAAAQPQNTGAVAGYTGPPLDATTVNAIRQFQQANGLPVTGNLDEATASAALNAPAKAAAAKAAASAASKEKTASNQAASAAKKTAAATASAQKKTASDAKAAQKSTAKAKVNNIKVKLAKATVTKNTNQINTLKVQLAQAQADYSNI